MSGICGAMKTQGFARIPEIIATTSHGLALHSEEKISHESDQFGGVGVAARFEGQQIYRSSRLIIACDAQIYNAHELQNLTGEREPISQKRTIAALFSDLYERFGCEFIEKIRGAFSVILWDTERRQLLVAVDPFGIKHLAYHQNHHCLLIASRVDALANSLDFHPTINPRAIANVLNFSANLAPETIFKEIQRMAPGTRLIAADNRVRMEQYWDLHYGGEDRNEKRLSRQLESLVQESVSAHCQPASDVETGAFLSGGTDSSTVVGMMSRLQHRPVKAFSIGFQEGSFNELEYARIAARAFGAEHFQYFVNAEDCFQALPGMVRFFDEPFGNSSAIPTFFCARLAAQNGVKALLAGDGGDELFGGNERYAVDKIFQLYHAVPKVLRKQIFEPALSHLPKHGLTGRASSYVRRANMPAMQRLLSFQFLSAHSPNQVFEGDFLQSLGSYTVFNIPSQHYERASASDHLDRLLYVDMKVTLGDSDLPKVTSMCELAGIQARFPFLDRSVAEFASRIPPHLKLKRFQKRYLFKKAFRNLLPPEIIRKKKHGFGIPVAQWLKSDRRMRELARDTLLSSRAFERGYFRRDFVEDLFRRHESDDSSYYGDTVWTFLVLELWHRQVVDSPLRVAV
jgi:asparagine synthase (glutamine-hydrolysing)